ncbi:UvrB/UvrC motif-containing protein [Heliophilum fasciatum]|uniref:Protein arginine kinase activator n=1 Tax=Heliophilum fasciatum TaxID=35700 RepID=A0A4R2RL59_9FIRM|nr:UvrB/UvrC motif-containing protein [Heliophilum fasciatum]MCW2277856.1 protein arginine kinase activator [Heliophilum fasciatum]TCP64652.1 protein arginine kinase activator [Heliophilum fasciatum]
MYCDECKKKPAAVHITQIINGEKSERNLCEDCARLTHKELSMAFDDNFPINKFLAGLLGYETPTADAALNLAFGEPEKCENCGVTYQQISQIGRLGCDQCYEHFHDKVEQLLRRVQGSARHTGKVPQRTGGAIRRQREIQGLRAQLQRLVAKEEFEAAAKVRDQIRELEKVVEMPSGE